MHAPCQNVDLPGGAKAKRLGKKTSKATAAYGADSKSNRLSELPAGTVVGTYWANKVPVTLEAQDTRVSNQSEFNLCMAEMKYRTT